MVAALAALLLSPDRMVVRSVGVASVVAVLGLAMVLRQRDRAGRAAAEAAAARRIRDEERFEEQLAEAEYAAEVAEERASRLGRRLTAEKSRLAKAETEIARLLKERAVLAAEQALREAEATQKAIEAARPKNPVTPVAYLRAANALRSMARRAELAEAQAEHLARRQAARQPVALPPAARSGAAPALPEIAAPALPEMRPAALPEVRTPHAPAVPAAPEPEPHSEPQSAAAPKPAPEAKSETKPEARTEAKAETSTRARAEGERPAVTASPVRPMLAAPTGQAAAAAMVPVARRQRPRPPVPGSRPASFSFFDRGAALRAAAPAPSVRSVSELDQQRAEREPAEHQPVRPEVRDDLADVLGDEVAGTEVVDLTPEDETELLDVGELRAKHS
jgi:hypothetical protein